MNGAASGEHHVSGAADAASARRAAQVRVEQVRSVYLQSPYTTTGSLLAGALLVYVMWGELPPTVLLSWALVLCVHQAMRIHHYRAYLKASPEEQAEPRWGRRYTFAAATAGLIWGSTGYLMFVPYSVPHQAFLALVLDGIALVAMTSLSAYAPAFYALIPLTLLPFVARMLMEPGVVHVYIAAPGLIVLGMALALGRNVNRLITETLTKRFENLELVEQLSEQSELAERARFEAEAANQSKTQFFAAAAHDLRQPLHAIALFVMALEEKVRDPETRNIVQKINTSVDALESFFDELLDISKIDAGITPNLTDFPVAPLLERVRNNFGVEARAKGLRLRVAACRHYVRSDPSLLERIVCNLVSNAIRYTQSGSVFVGCRRRGGRLRFEVRDSGIGIPPDKTQKIFDEFYQVANPERSRGKGMGLGLSIVRRLCMVLGHEVDVVSAPGRGSTFFVTVPLGDARASADAAHAAAPPAPADLSGRFIVVVDDEPAIVEAMSLLLRGWGARVLAARSEEGLIEEIQEIGMLPDLILVDFQLGDGVVGSDVIARLREALDPDIPAVIITGMTLPERMEEIRAGGCELLLKPVNPARLREVIDAKLRRLPGLAGAGAADLTRR